MHEVTINQSRDSNESRCSLTSHEDAPQSDSGHVTQEQEEPQENKIYDVTIASRSHEYANESGATVSDAINDASNISSAASSSVGDVINQGLLATEVRPPRRYFPSLLLDQSRSYAASTAAASAAAVSVTSLQSGGCKRRLTLTSSCCSSDETMATTMTSSVDGVKRRRRKKTKAEVGVTSSRGM